jgi:hypothetical protein
MNRRDRMALALATMAASAAAVVFLSLLVFFVQK